MKKKALIVISVIFGMGVALSAPAFATDSGLMSGMKGIAKEQAKEVVNQGTQKAGEAASKKIDELAGNTTASQSETVDKAVKTKENAEEMQNKATHEMEETKGNVDKHMKATKEIKDTGSEAVHETTGK
jgi:flagellar basal body-associated protein FliL